MELIDDRVQIDKKISNSLTHDGFCVIRLADCDEDTLIKVATQIGQIQRHPKSKNNGVREIINKGAIDSHHKRFTISQSS